MRFSVLLCYCLLCYGSNLAADILYSVTDLGVNYRGVAIDNAGQVALNYAGHAFLYSNGQKTDLGSLGPSHSSVAYAINNVGQVTGYSSTLTSTDAFLFSNGQLLDLRNTLGGDTASGYGINDAGQVTGEAAISHFNNTFHAFLYTDGQMHDLGTLGISSFGQAVNNTGQVTGYSEVRAGNLVLHHAFLYADGQMTDLGTLGGLGSEGTAINSAGQITGNASVSSGNSHAFLYSNGQMTDLGLLSTGPYSQSYGLAINSTGEVVGTAVSSAAFGTSAFMYRDGQMLDLNNLVDPALHLTLTEATAINDEGQIVANLNYNYGENPPPNHAYLLTPIAVPEPGTFTVVGLALAALALGLHRSKLVHVDI